MRLLGWYAARAATREHPHQGNAVGGAATDVLKHRPPHLATHTHTHRPAIVSMFHHHHHNSARSRCSTYRRGRRHQPITHTREDEQACKESRHNATLDTQQGEIRPCCRTGCTCATARAPNARALAEKARLTPSQRSDTPPAARTAQTQTAAKFGQPLIRRTKAHHTTTADSAAGRLPSTFAATRPCAAHASVSARTHVLPSARPQPTNTFAAAVTRVLLIAHTPWVIPHP